MQLGYAGSDLVLTRGEETDEALRERERARARDRESESDSERAIEKGPQGPCGR